MQPLYLWAFGGADLATRDCGARFRCHARNLRLCGLLGGADLAARDCGAGFRCHARNLHLAGYFGVVSRRGMFVEVLFRYASNLLFISNVYYLDLACVSAIVSFSSSFIPR